jgi:signal transduction histidine kinase
MAMRPPSHNATKQANRPVLVKGNAMALEQAVRNLIDNAIRFGDPGSTISIRIGDDGSVQVIDRGPGIPAPQRAQIFDRFVSADRRSTGAGLGLSIVRRTVEAHDGSIDVSDTPGGGATFTLRFPNAG